jgi:hypothetical protein
VEEKTKGWEPLSLPPAPPNPSPRPGAAHYRAADARRQHYVLTVSLKQRGSYLTHTHARTHTRTHRERERERERESRVLPRAHSQSCLARKKGREPHLREPEAKSTFGGARSGGGWAMGGGLGGRRGGGGGVSALRKGNGRKKGRGTGRQGGYRLRACKLIAMKDGKNSMVIKRSSEAEATHPYRTLNVQIINAPSWLFFLIG